MTEIKDVYQKSVKENLRKGLNNMVVKMSETCPECGGKMKPMDDDEDMYMCDECGYKMDMDEDY